MSPATASRKPSGSFTMLAVLGAEVVSVAAPFSVFAAFRVTESVGAVLEICAISNSCRSSCALIEDQEQGRHLDGAKTTLPAGRGLPQITARRFRSAHENRCQRWS